MELLREDDFDFLIFLDLIFTKQKRPLILLKIKFRKRLQIIPPFMQF